MTIIHKGRFFIGLATLMMSFIKSDDNPLTSTFQIIFGCWIMWLSTQE